jgi:outer membrane receptor protein involved in Fe transport
MDLTYHFTDRFDVQIGGRESNDTYSTAAYVETGPFNFFLVGSIAPVVTTPAHSAGTNTFTYLLTPRFKVTSNFMLYARLASGFRPGGPNAYSATPGVPAHFNPDKTQNYEVGLKSDFLNHKLSVDASLYYIDWKSLQIALALPTAIPYQANGSGAKSEGVEFSVETRPVSGLTVGGWVSYDNAVLTRAFPAASTAYGLAGDRLPFAPRFSGNLSIERDFRLWSGATAFVGGTVGYVGDRLGIFQPTSLRQDLQGYGRADFSAGVRRDSWTARIYVTNVSDARGLLNGGIGYVAPNGYVYIAPRTVGLSLTKNFFWRYPK